jgi:hypothetical protein
MRGRAFAFLVLLTLGFEPLGAADFKPPFGLSWGGSPGRLVEWAKRFKLDLLVKAPGNDPKMSILLITSQEGGLPGGHEASMLEARFREGRLFEVVVHYSFPGRQAGFVEERFIILKRELKARHGAFKLAGRQKVVKDGILTNSDAYHLEPAPGLLLMLAYTTVKDVKRGDVAARFSVIYHSDRILQEEVKALAEEPEPVRLPERTALTPAPEPLRLPERKALPLKPEPLRLPERK